MTATCAARWPRRLRNAIDYALGYGIKDCEWCGVRFSARDEWQDGQTVKAGPYTTRLAYCREARPRHRARDIVRRDTRGGRMSDPFLWFIAGAVIARTIDALVADWKNRNK